MTGKGSLNHNSRKFHAKNTDPNRTHWNVEYCNEDIKDVYDMDRVVAVLGENKVKEAIEVAKHLEQANAKQKIKKRCVDRDV